MGSCFLVFAAGELDFRETQCTSTQHVLAAYISCWVLILDTGVFSPSQLCLSALKRHPHDRSAGRVHIAHISALYRLLYIQIVRCSCKMRSMASLLLRLRFLHNAVSYLPNPPNISHRCFTLSGTVSSWFKAPVAGLCTWTSQNPQWHKLQLLE